MTSREDAAWPMALDFAHVSGRSFIAYGWIAGLGSHVSRARLQVGDWFCNIMADALVVARPDVSAHLGASHPVLTEQVNEEARHEHGFFVLIDWEGSAEPAIAESHSVRLSVLTQSGVAQHQEWPVHHGAEPVADTLRHHERAMRQLIGRQSPRQVELLTGLFQPPLVLRAGDLQGSAMAYGPALQLSFACVIQDKIILAGQLPGPALSFHALTARWYLQRGDRPRAIEVDILPLVRELPGAPRWESTNPDEPPPLDPRAFVATIPCPDDAQSGGTELELTHQAPSGVGRQRILLRSNPQDVQRRLAAWLNRLDASNRVSACEHVLRVITSMQGEMAGWRESLVGHINATVAALSGNVDHRAGAEQVTLYLEQAVLVPGAGLMLIGWAFADSAKPLEVWYHCEGVAYPVSSRWVRRPRMDVQRHLQEQGLGQVDEPGFICLVEVPTNVLPLRPAHLKVALGELEWRVKVAIPSAAEPVRRLTRTLLSTVDPQCSELRRLMDDHVGRAVQATWSRRPPPRSAAQQWSFGPRPTHPTVSIVIPLYGRNDLADYQLALFTDDPDLHGAEIIYVMDDPSILHEFRQKATDLYRMHGLPFTLAYPGDNLGFAGATNHGASLARAPLLLLLNSDVFPNTPGWLSQMARTYRDHPDTGLLGVKLLYEDGSVQHAGMLSERFEGWADMWVNNHPHKGLHPDGLNGVHTVSAVTAACVMIETAFYRSLGGLSEDYIIGDFEDSDLCYRAQASGRPSRVDLDICLYHLERQSQDLGDAGWRTALTLYNCWVHDHRWNPLLQAATP